MIKHFAIQYLRIIRRNKSFAIISVLGLVIAFSISFLTLIYLLNESSYENFHSNRNRIYRIISEYPKWDEIEPTTPFILSSTLEKEFPEVENSTRIRVQDDIEIRKDNFFIRERSFLFSDNSIFEIFTLPIISGDPITPLKDPYSVVISEKAANKYFNNTNPIGKNIEIKFKGVTYNLIVNAVMNDIQYNSIIQADIIGNLSIYLNYQKERYKKKQY